MNGLRACVAAGAGIRRWVGRVAANSVAALSITTSITTGSGPAGSVTAVCRIAAGTVTADRIPSLGCAGLDVAALGITSDAASAAGSVSGDSTIAAENCIPSETVHGQIASETADRHLSQRRVTAGSTGASCTVSAGTASATSRCSTLGVTASSVAAVSIPA